MENETRLTYRNVRSTGKTFLWDVFSGDVHLGEIKWYAPWRRYCFFPKGYTLFDRSCLTEICNMIDEQTRLRKETA